MKNLHIAPVLLVTLLCITAAAQSSCDPVEPAVPDTTRCEGKEGDDLLDCCWNTGVRDCQAGYIPLQSLYGPEGVGYPPPEYDEFYYRCEYEENNPSMAGMNFCEAYCAACPDYVMDMERMYTWGGEDVPAEEAHEFDVRDCLCL